MIKNFLNCFVLIVICKFQNALGKEIGIEDGKFWRDNGLKHLQKIVEENKLDGIDASKYKTKNIVFFLGDGMGINSVTAGRIYKGQLHGQTGEESTLVFEKFPHTGLSKTYCVDRQIPDSASTATAIFTGSKTNYYYIGMDSTATSLNSTKGQLSSIMEWAQQEGKFTGIVTTTRITHATPAASYAKIFDRDWECDSAIPIESRHIYKDIARQLVENSPGNQFNVIFGGGLEPMGKPNINQKEKFVFTGSTEEVCNRTDSKNLVNDWLNLAPTQKNKTRKFVQNREDLLNINVKNISNILGLFRNNHMSYGLGRDENEPSLSEMTQQAIRLLTELSETNGNPGFVLLIEGGRIDHGHHSNYAHAALQELVDLDEAIDVAINMTNRSETLTIVTADHSHSLTMNGYAKRGNDILGYYVEDDDPPYETLTYANGPGFHKHRWGLPTSLKTSNPTLKNSDTWVPVDQLSKEIRSHPTYMNFAALPLEDETHGGEDVAVYAMGAGSTLIRSTFEENYLGIVMSYVACMGPAKEYNSNCLKSNKIPSNKSSGGAYVKSEHFNIILVLSISILCWKIIKN